MLGKALALPNLVGVAALIAGIVWILNTAGWLVQDSRLVTRLRERGVTTQAVVFNVPPLPGSSALSGGQFMFNVSGGRAWTDDTQFEGAYSVPPPSGHGSRVIVVRYDPSDVNAVLPQSIVDHPSYTPMALRTGLAAGLIAVSLAVIVWWWRHRPRHRLAPARHAPESVRKTVIAAISRQLDSEISTEDLRQDTGLTDEELMPALASLADAGWIAHRAPALRWALPGYRDAAANWRLTPVGHDEAARQGLLDEPELTRTADGGMVLRPSRRRLRSWYLGSVLGGIPLLGVIIVRGLLEMPWWAAGLVLAGGAALGVTVFRARVWMEVTRLTPEAVVVRAWYGRTRTVPRRSISEVVLVQMRSSRSLLNYMLFVDHERRCLARAAVDGISRESRQTFAKQLGVPVSDPATSVSPGQLRAQFPGSVSWATAHPVIVALIITPFMLAAVVGGVVGWAVANSGPVRVGQTVAVSCSASACPGRSGGPEVGTVAVLKVVDPAQATGRSAPAASGSRLVAVELQFTGKSSMDFSPDPLGEITVVDSGGHPYIASGSEIDNGSQPTVSAGPLLPQSIDLTQGESVKGYEVFQLPDSARVAKVEYTPAGDTLSTNTFGGQGVWNVG